MPHDLRKRYPISLRWVEIAPMRHVPCIRDGELKIIEPFFDFAIQCAKKKISGHSLKGRYNSAIEPIGYVLKGLAIFLKLEGKTWDQMDDGLLEKYRDDELERILRHPAHRNEMSAHRTANKKLRTIYAFYTWAEVDAALTTGLIGWTSGAIRSTLPLTKQFGGKINTNESERHPLCFKNVGEKSVAADGQYWATAQDLEDIADHFRATQTAEAASRNELIMRLVAWVGWRRGSVNSLTVSQFSQEKIKLSIRNDRPFLEVVPELQKLQREMAFGVPYSLALKVSRYIEDERAKVLARLGQSVDAGAPQHVFLSLTTGKPLDDKSLSEIFGTAFHAIGAPKGAGIHSVRRKFAEEAADAETQRRIKEGLSTAQEDITMAIAAKLGQTSALSQNAYRRVTNRPKLDSIEVRQRDELAAKEMEILALKSKIAALEAESHARCSWRDDD